MVGSALSFVAATGGSSKEPGWVPGGGIPVLPGTPNPSETGTPKQWFVEPKTQRRTNILSGCTKSSTTTRKLLWSETDCHAGHWEDTCPAKENTLLWNGLPYLNTTLIFLHLNSQPEKRWSSGNAGNISHLVFSVYFINKQAHRFFLQSFFCLCRQRCSFICCYKSIGRGITGELLLPAGLSSPQHDPWLWAGRAALAHTTYGNSGLSWWWKQFKINAKLWDTQSLFLHCPRLSPRCI